MVAVLAVSLTPVVPAPETGSPGSLLFWVTAHTEVSVARPVRSLAVWPAVSQRLQRACHTKPSEGHERYIGRDKWRRSLPLFIIQLIYSTPLHSSTHFPLSTLSLALQLHQPTLSKCSSRPSSPLSPPSPPSPRLCPPVRPTETASAPLVPLSAVPKS